MPNRRTKKHEEWLESQKEMIQGLEESGFKLGIEGYLRINLDVPKTEFPSLEDLTEEFENKNNLNLRDVTDYDFPIVGLDNEPKTYNSGLILNFKEGNVVLSVKRLQERQVEPTFGRGLIQSWRREYVMSGILNNEDAELGAIISYSRAVKTIIDYPQKSEDYDPFRGGVILNARERYVPKGEIQKSVHRRDDSSLWFIIDGKKK